MQIGRSLKIRIDRQIIFFHNEMDRFIVLPYGVIPYALKNLAREKGRAGEVVGCSITIVKYTEDNNKEIRNKK